ncbi:hypothetical protein SUDANB66_02660 [Streptomyces sp. SudanB66_2053]
MRRGISRTAWCGRELTLGRPDPRPWRSGEAYDTGIAERTVLVEFDSFEQAVAARESAAYQEAPAALADGAERDFRIVEGLD